MKLHHLRTDAHEICPVDHDAFVVDGAVDFEVTDTALARSLLEQVDNYGPADDASVALLAEITAEAQASDDVRRQAAAAGLAAAEDRLATARAELAALQPPPAELAPPADSAPAAPAKTTRHRRSPADTTQGA